MHSKTNETPPREYLHDIGFTFQVQDSISEFSARLCG